MGGYLGIPHVLGERPEHFQWDVEAVSVTAVAAGLGLAWVIYRRRLLSARQLVEALALPYTVLQRRYYIDELYAWYVAVIQQRLIAGLCAWVERSIIIGGLVNGTAALTRAAGELVRRCQVGKVQAYVLGFLVGVVWLLSNAMRH